MKKLPSAAEVRELAEELRLSREHFVALEYYDDAQDMLAAIELLLQFAELLERDRWRKPSEPPDIGDGVIRLILDIGSEYGPVEGEYDGGEGCWDAQGEIIEESKICGWRYYPEPPEAE